MSSDAISLDTFIEFMVQNEIDDKRLYGHFATLDVRRLGRLLQHLEKVDNIPKRKGRSSRTFEGRRSALKGKVYERIVRLIVDGVRCFETSSNVASTTNELDVLIRLGPSSRFVPAFRDWGTHCICECKYHVTYVQADWVTKLHSVLQTHSSSVGLLFSRKGIAPQGNGAKIGHYLQLMAARSPSTFVLCFDREDLQRCANGENFLELVSRRFVELRAGINRLALLAS